MPRIYKAVLCLLIIVSTEAFTQNYINSPYTLNNIGDILDEGLVYNRSLGGSSAALRPHNVVNYLNPASYTNQDTNSFIFQAGFTGRSSDIYTANEKFRTYNSNIEYLAMGFPVTKWWNMSVGAVPFSRVHFNVREKLDSTVVGEHFSFDYAGSGGFNEFYFGNAIRLGNLLSVGANVSYLFGALNYTTNSYLPGINYYSARVEQKTDYIASDFYLKLGAQFHPLIKEKHRIVLGAAYDLETNIGLEKKIQTRHFNDAGLDNSSNWYIDTLLQSNDTLAPLVMPQKISLGLSYSYNKILTITGEYIRQDWTGKTINNSSYLSQGVYESLRFGIEYVPVPTENKTRIPYYKRMHYRAGFFNTNTYLVYNDMNIKNFGASSGISFPIKYSRKAYTGTTFDIGYQYSIRGTTNNGLVKENTHIVTFGLTLHDFWFLKPKYD
ncbi:MAG: hypothetical protein JXB34_09620 [Bacteroidales bacterium]|nr:hypothetical protein [Bacteroidales bacterium]